MVARVVCGHDERIPSQERQERVEPQVPVLQVNDIRGERLELSDQLAAEEELTAWLTQPRLVKGVKIDLRIEFREIRRRHVLRQQEQHRRQPTESARQPNRGTHRSRMKRGRLSRGPRICRLTSWPRRRSRDSCGGECSRTVYCLKLMSLAVRLRLVKTYASVSGTAIAEFTTADSARHRLGNFEDLIERQDLPQHAAIAVAIGQKQLVLTEDPQHAGRVR